ncbi:hypothetical protein [Sphingomonas sp. Leaf4]|uniref:hypothetical protein n=1 Tax=Sphingomonas sp. Leaf4 TaxID=2876553 RepID=UPI001E40FFC8|nr:hypothetical protein [Sphingomonas sp. Leaf4]
MTDAGEGAGSIVAGAAEGGAWSRRQRAVRARTVFDLLVMGHSNKAVAGILGL